MLQSGTYLFWRLECWTAAHKSSICSPFATFYTPNSHTEERAGLFQKSCVNVSLSLPLSGKHLLWVMSSACEMFYFGMASRRNHSPMWLKTFLISQHSWRPCMLVPCAIVEKSTRSIQSKSQCQCLSVLAGYNAASITTIMTGSKLPPKPGLLLYLWDYNIQYVREASGQHVLPEPEQGNATSD